MSNPDLLLINPPFHMRVGSSNFLPLGLGYIMSATINSGFTAEIINCAEQCHSFVSKDLAIFQKYLSTELQKYDPVLIGIGPCVTSHIRALQIISIVCKKVFPNTPIVCGGPLASMKNQEWVFFEELDIKYIIKGDGEESIPSLIETIKAGLPPSSCPTVSYKGHIVFNQISDIDSIAFPFRIAGSNSQFSGRRQNPNKTGLTMPMITSRGCMYNCDFCVSGNLKTHFRKRSNENIIDEMLYLRDNFGVTDIIFYDDCFFCNPKTSCKDIHEFCKLLLDKNLDMTWQIELRTDLLLSLSKESILLLEEAGCRQINIGIEKTNNMALVTLGKTSFITGLKEKNKQIIELSCIKITATFILGGINEDEATVKQLIADSKQMSLSEAHYNPLFVYPDTGLYTKCGFKDRDWYQLIQEDKRPWGEVFYENKELSSEKILDLLDHAYTEFYSNSKEIHTIPYIDRFNLRGNTFENL